MTGARPGRDRLLPVLATERTLRAALLLAVGIVLIAHLHGGVGGLVERIAAALNFNPHRNGIARIVGRAQALGPRQLVAYGAVSLGYGALEGAEAYGLWRHRRWGEYLTVIATAVLLIPEVWELVKDATPLKIAGTVLNLAIVLYLVYRLRRQRR